MIVLVGLMGAGKSSVGNKLSDFLNVGFIDADNEIEKAAGMTIVEIFEDGENRQNWRCRVRFKGTRVADWVPFWFAGRPFILPAVDFLFHLLRWNFN